MRWILRGLHVVVRGEHGSGERAGAELGVFVAERGLERLDRAPRRLGAAAMAAGAVREDGDQREPSRQTRTLSSLDFR